MDVEKQKISIDLKSNSAKNLRYDNNYYFHNGKYFKIPKRQSAEYSDYQELMKQKREQAKPVNLVANLHSNHRSLFHTLTEREIHPRNSQKHDLILHELANGEFVSKTQVEKFLDVNDLRLDPFHRNLLLGASKNGYASVFAIDRLNGRPAAYQQGFQYFHNEITSAAWSNTTPCLASLACLNGAMSVVDHTLSVKGSMQVKSTIWDHQWKYSTSEILLGCEKGVVQYNVECRKNSNCVGSPSDVFAICIDRLDVYVFYGTRNSGMLINDFRAKKQIKLGNENAPINHLYQTRDLNYLVSSSCTGMVHYWDLRMHRSLYSFKHHNRYERKLKFNYFEDENLFVSGGQDKNVYIWDMVEGKLLRVITPPTSVHSVNAICFGNHWKLQQNGSDSNRDDELDDLGFWCILDGEMQFFTL